MKLNSQLHSVVMDKYSLKLPHDDDNKNIEKMFKLVFLRHPFERLVSAFHDKFVEGPDPEFVRSILKADESLYVKHLKWIVKSGSKSPQLSDQKISFQKFVTFVLSELKSKTISHGTFHWLPFTDYCHLCHINYNFIGKLETFEEDLHILMSHIPTLRSQQVRDVLRLKKNSSLAKSNKTSNILILKITLNSEANKNQRFRVNLTKSVPDRSMVP